MLSTKDLGGHHGRLQTLEPSAPRGRSEAAGAGGLRRAWRKFHELWPNHRSPVGEQALKFFGELYDIERDVAVLAAEERKRIRQERSREVADALHQWLTAQRQKVPEGSATARATDYSLKRWQALTRHIDDGDLPADNNREENQIRPIALGRSNWLFVGSLRACRRAAAVMSLVHSARSNGHEPHTYLKDILERLPTHPASVSRSCCPIAGSRQRPPELRPSSRRDHRAITL